MLLLLSDGWNFEALSWPRPSDCRSEAAAFSPGSAAVVSPGLSSSQRALSPPSIYHIPPFDQCQGRAQPEPLALFVEVCVCECATEIMHVLSCVWRARAMHWPVYVCARAYRLGLALISRAAFAFELKSRRTAEAGVGAARPPFGLIRLKSPARLHRRADGLCQKMSRDRTVAE